MVVDTGEAIIHILYPGGLSVEAGNYFVLLWYNFLAFGPTWLDPNCVS